MLGSWSRASAGGAGFTLAELVVALAVTSIIMVAIGSTILIAGMALPDSQKFADATINAAAAADRLAAELQYGVSFTERSANAVTFTVADRNGDAVDETIRYAWSGTPGGSLTRQYNNGRAVGLLGGVYDFSLAYDVTAATTTQTTAGTESGQVLLATYSAILNLTDFPIQNLQRYAEYFMPVFPPNTVSWKVTSVQFNARRASGTTGQASIELQLPTSGNNPCGVVLEQQTLLESTLLTSYTPQTFSYTHVSGLSPGRGLCVVIDWVNDTTACRIQGRGSGAAPANSQLLESTDRGASWSAQAGKSLLFSVYGTITTAGTPQVQTVYNLKGVRIALKAGRIANPTVYSAARVLNAPLVSGP
jgi:prepilin-type N-terminal cleavage/methylation domain-containing protein